jgi:hypothetical protein
MAPDPLPAVADLRRISQCRSLAAQSIK